jgi:N-acetyl-1-D-myo-inositol-2-amino-2-deoxy-alpha-D-glucopyranoside deacetylase
MITLLLVHAHPDDESILTGGVMAQAHLDGHRVVLITATRGEEEAGSPDQPAGQPPMEDIRTEELRQACEILGVDRQEFLGFVGMGRNDNTADQRSRSFHLASLSDVANRLAALLREELPEVIVTYGPDGTYGHPDHRRAHDATLAALDVLAGEGWLPRKVYLQAVPRSLVRIIVEAARTAGIELPVALARMKGTPDDEITTEVDVNDVLDRKLAACAVHLSQMHPGIPLAAMAAQIFETAFGIERFTLARGELGGERPETSLFAGL